MEAGIERIIENDEQRAIEDADRIALLEDQLMALIDALGTYFNFHGAILLNYLSKQETVYGNYTFVQDDSGLEKIFTGTAATWTIPA